MATELDVQNRGDVIVFFVSLLRQFWSHHFHCRFADQKPAEIPVDTTLDFSSMKLCTGRESLTAQDKYEQEGLVPFVGEFRGTDDGQTVDNNNIPSPSIFEQTWGNPNRYYEIRSQSDNFVL